MVGNRHTHAVLIGVLLAAAPTTALGQGADADVRAGDSIQPLPANFKAGDVTVDEQPRQQVPLDAVMRELDGTTVTLGKVLEGEMPTILTFNYSNCPNLCSLQLTALTGALPAMRWKVGQQFRIVTVVLDPSETPEKAAATRQRYIDKLPPGSDPAGWTFLLAPSPTKKPGDDATVRRIAQSVGFQYTFLNDTGEYAHPAALTFLGTDGRVMRYVYGAQFEPSDLTASIMTAGLGNPETSVGFMYRCFHWDPTANSHAKAGQSMLRYGAAGFAVLILALLAFLHTVRRTRIASPGVVRP